MQSLPKLEITTPAGAGTTKPTFVSGKAPSVDSSTDTTATVKFTASEAGKVFWVLYAANAPAPGDAAALIKDATSDNAGEKRSGADEVVTTAEKTVTIGGLTAGTTYNFYAVLQDSAGNNGELSAVLEITTPDKTPPTFSVAPMVDSSTDTTATLKFTASEAGKLFWVLYADGTPAPADAAAVIGAASANTVGLKQSVADEPVTTAEKTVAITGLDASTTYNFYAVLQDSAGNNGALSAKVEITTAATDTTKPTFSVAPMLDSSTDTGVTVTLTASEVVTLYWTVYTDEKEAPPDAETLIGDATADTQPATISARSVTDGVAVTTAAHTIAISGLTPGATHYFYAVLVDAADNKSDVSLKVEFTTAAGVVFAEEFLSANIGISCRRVYGDNDCDAPTPGIPKGTPLEKITATKSAGISDAIVYSISGADMDKFGIHPSSGEVTVDSDALTGLDADSSYAFEVTATAGSHTGTIRITIVNTSETLVVGNQTISVQSSPSGSATHSEQSGDGVGAGTPASDNWRQIDLTADSATSTSGIIDFNTIDVDGQTLYVSLNSPSQGGNNKIKIQLENADGNSGAVEKTFTADGNWHQVTWEPDDFPDSFDSSAVNKIVFILSDTDSDASNGLGAQIINYDEVYFREER